MNQNGSRQVADVSQERRIEMKDTSRKYLIVKGVGGVGNRFTSLMKAIKYAKKTNRTIYLEWCDGMFGPTGENIFFKYFDLKNVAYTDSPDEVLELLDKGSSTFPRILHKEDITNALLKNYYACTPWIAQFPIYKVGMGLVFQYKLGYLFGLQSFQRVDDEKGYWGAIRDIFKGDNFPLGAALPTWLTQDIVVFADFRPLCSIARLFDYIQLKDSFYQQYKKYADENKFSNVIGVHVRYTDKKPKSQLKKLIGRLQSDLERNAELKIFLCSDNNDIINQFRNIFQDKVIFFEKEMPNVDHGGIHKWAYWYFEEDQKEQLFYDCLADMWLLSMTKYLYWQGNSSFSLISKVIKNDDSTTFDWLKF